MCRRTICLTLFVLVLSLAGYVSADDEDVKIPAAGSEKPILDGVEDRIWSFTTEQFLTITLEGTDPSSSEDCSGRWKALWDSEYLYVLIDVNDEALVQDSDAGSGWDDDRIEIFIDGDNSKGTSTDGKNDYQYCFRWNNGEVETPIEWYFRDTAENVLEGVEYAVATTESGYLFEIKLPWLTIIGEPAQLGQLIGIEVIIDDDDDGGGRDTQVSWYIETTPPHNPSLWGTALLILGADKEACNPNPTDGQTDVPRDAILRWNQGKYADKHDVYFGTSFVDVNEASTTDPRGVLVNQNQDDTTYEPEGLFEFGQTYHWRVDEVNDMDPNSPWKGDIWSFTAANFTVLDDFEDYNDASNRIFDTWTDYAVNNTGMTVGHFDPPFAEQDIVHSGSQSMYMRYDNDGTVNEGTDYEQGGMLLYSEVERTWSDPQDWTIDGAESLTLWFRGLPAPVGSFTPKGQAAYTMTGAGADIWETSDSFHFAYKRLSGAGSIKAKVVSMTNTHNSAKAGVMIRDSLEPDSVHAMMAIQPVNEVQFLRRPVMGLNSEADGQSEIGTPVWVKLTRSLNTFRGEYSEDGDEWETLGSLTIPMNVDVYVGLIVCSHDNFATCEAEFSEINMTGAVTGEWQSQDIGIETNAAESMYVVLEDNAGTNAVVTNSDTGASAAISWTEWNIPLADFTGVNPLAIKKMTIGVGDRANTQPGGAGDLYIDDIRLYLP